MFLREIAFAWRRLARRPGAAFLAIGSLALAIGFCTAGFSVVDAYYWRALPVDDPSTLVYAAATDREGRNDQITWAEYEAISRQRGALSGITFENRQGPIVKLPDRDDFPITAGVSNNYFDLFGVKAAMGRVFHPGDAAEGQVVLSDHYWRTAFGGDLSICGQTISVGGAPLAVLGVLPPYFAGMQRGIRVDLFVPEPVMFGSLRLSSRGNLKGNDFQPILRLTRGATMEAARRDMDQALRRVETAGLAPGPARRAALFPFSRRSDKPEMNTGDLFPWIALLVMTVAAANFANLRLVDNQARRRETGIRLALGADRIALLRQHLTETLLVAVAAAGLGLLLSAWLIDLAPAALYAGQRYSDYFIRLDARAFAFCAGAMVLIALLGALIPMRDSWKCGIVPALQATRSPSASRWLSGLVLAQIALITAVCYVAGLLWQSRNAAAAIRPAMDPDRKMLLITGFWRAGGLESINLADGLARDLSSIPGVSGVAYGRRVMMAGSGGGQRVAFERSGQPALTFRFNQVSPNYFAVTGARVLAGRSFSDADGPGAAPVVMVSQSFVRKFYPEGNALYSWARIGGRDRQIVGVVEDGPSHHLKEQIEPFLYFPFAQRPSGDITYFVNASVDAGKLAAPAREYIRKAGGLFTATDLFTLAQHLRGQRRDEELAADVSGGLALLGMALAAAGLFGVTLHAVGRRMREFGVRVAMGATPAALGGQVIRQALRIAAAGVALGGAVSWVGVRLLRSYLEGVKPAHLPTFVAAAALVTGLALISAVIPALRAAKADPMAALRVE